MSISSRRRGPSTITILTVASTFAALLLIAGVPKSPRELSARLLQDAPEGSAFVQPPFGVPPFQIWMTSNNARLLGPINFRVHGPPGCAVWLFTSSNSGPSFLGPYPVELSSDWVVLQGPVFLPSNGVYDFPSALPTDPALVGLEGMFQAGAYDIVENDVTFSSGVLHRIHGSVGSGMRVLVVRQVSNLLEAPHATQAANDLVSDLAFAGHQVVVADDFVPEDLASFDVLMDVRFSYGLAEAEKLNLSRFLQRYGGVFVLGGGSALSSPGADYRSVSVRHWMSAQLGIATAAHPGASVSTGTVEEVSPITSPHYIASLQGTLPMPYRVEHEGGHFGDLGSHTSGTPWITSSTTPPVIYGMHFTPDDISNFPVRGSLAVLWNGSASALSGDQIDHRGRQVMSALVSFLDQ